VAEEYAREAGAKFFEVSARTGKGVEKVFKEAAQGALPVIPDQVDGMMTGLRNAAGAGAAKFARRASVDRKA
jgi:hypothetical protein